MAKPIYLDYNATTPIDPAVARAMLPYIREHFGNPSSIHPFGAAAKKAVERARAQIARMLNCRADEIVLTSGGSESNNHAIKGIARAYANQGNHIITSAVEHPAVGEVCRYLERNGYEVTYLPVDKDGLVDPEDLERAIRPETILITVMHANNEVGTIQPIREISRIAHARGIVVHSDCAQSAGKIPVRVDELEVDLLSIAGHKLYAPKGIGALYVKSGLRLEKLIHGADHELNRRAGTENVIGSVALGKACELIEQNLEAYAGHMRKMRDRLERGLKERFPDIKVNGHPEKRLPNTCSASFRGLEANTVLSEFNQVAASAGAACHSDGIEVSSVLEAMSVPLEYAMGTIRFSVGRSTTAAEIDRALEEVFRVVEGLNPAAPPAGSAGGEEDFKLTRFTRGLGCACKLRPQLLEEVLEKMSAPADRNILVGPDTSDDAAVYRISDDTAIVQTVDFFTPIVDDAFDFGRIAASNSLSDVYAMGARPLFALNIVAFPSNRLPISVLERILAGAQRSAGEAGIAIIGGHTVDDTEPKFGLAVTGLVHPGKIMTNSGAQPGDVLILTKPIGTGVLSTALKRGLLEEGSTGILVDTMALLNKAAAEAMQQVGAHACTDVTGFGLLGHLLEMMAGSDTTAEIESRSIPLLPGTERFVGAGILPGGTRDNFRFTAPRVEYDKEVPETTRLVLNDAQTAGGLLISLPERSAESFLSGLPENEVLRPAVIGRVRKPARARVRVYP